MQLDRLPKPGEIYLHFKNRSYQIITVALHTETEEAMVVYQALYGDFKTYVRPLASFLSEVDHNEYPDVEQKYRFELQSVNHLTSSDFVKATNDGNAAQMTLSQNIDSTAQSEQDSLAIPVPSVQHQDNLLREDHSREIMNSSQVEVIEGQDKDYEKEGIVNPVLLKFLEAESFYKKLEVISSNRKHMNDRLVNDIAVSLDCAVDEGPLDQRIQGLMYCLQALCRFEDKRLR